MSSIGMSSTLNLDRWSKKGMLPQSTLRRLPLQTSTLVVLPHTFESIRFIMALICFIGPTS